MKHKLFNTLIIVLSTLFITSCGYTDEEKALMKQYETIGTRNAYSYLNQKYGLNAKDLKLLDVDTEKEDTGPIPDFTPDPTGNVELKFSHNNKEFRVYISGEDETTFGYDNYQRDIILRDVKSTLSKYINGNIKRIDISYGMHYTYRTGNIQYGMVNEYYDGYNLSDIVDDDSHLSITVHSINCDANDMDFNAIKNIFGTDADYLFIDYIDEESYNIAQDSNEFLYPDSNYYLDQLCILIDEYTIIYNGEITTKGIEYNTFEEFYYILEDGTYCNFIETELEDASNWNGYGFINAKQLSKAYLIETDAKSIDFWVPYNTFGYHDDISLAVQYMRNGELEFHSRSSFIIGDKDYLYGTVYMRDDYSDMKLAVFADLRR